MGHPRIKGFFRAAAGILSYPQDPRSFGQVFGSLTSAHYTRGRITHVRRETPDTVTLFFTAGEGWIPHRAGQWARIGVEVDGKRIWRPYSISAPEHGDPSITVKAQGLVSEHIVERTAPGNVLYLERPEGQFLLPDTPTELLFMVAGSGITPVMSMLRTLMPRRPDHDVVLVYVSRSRESCIFHDEILELADQFPGLRPVFWFTEERGRLDASDADALAELCPDHADRVTYASGPDSFVSAVEDLSRSHGGPPRGGTLRCHQAVQRRPTRGSLVHPFRDDPGGGPGRNRPGGRRTRATPAAPRMPYGHLPQLSGSLDGRGRDQHPHR